MSVYESSLLAFIGVIESGLIPQEDWRDLQNLPGNLPEDIEDIYETIEEWLQLEFRQPIREAYQQRWKALKAASSLSQDISPPDFKKDLGVGNSKSPTPPNQPCQSLREQLINSIIKNLPLSEKKTPKS